MQAIHPHLADFYDQYMGRWAVKKEDGLFGRPEQGAFLERFPELAADTD